MAKEFWIKQGTNEWKYDHLAEDDYYDAISETPAEGGIHVIEKSAYNDLLKLTEEMHDCLFLIWKRSTKLGEIKTEEHSPLKTAIELVDKFNKLKADTED